jgi:hypothetical protein
MTTAIRPPDHHTRSLGAESRRARKRGLESRGTTPNDKFQAVCAVDDARRQFTRLSGTWGSGAVDWLVRKSKAFGKREVA